MNKRGQIYILVALVLAVVIFSMSQIINITYQKSMESRFESLTENYVSESSKLVNILVANPDLEPEQKMDLFINFTTMFTSYAKTVNPDFQIIYAFKSDEETYIGNFLTSNILIEIGGEIQLLEGCLAKVPANIEFEGFGLKSTIEFTDLEDCTERFEVESNEIHISIEGISYSFKVYENRPEIVIVGWEEREEQRKVYAGGEISTETTELLVLSDFCKKNSQNEYCQDGINCNEFYLTQEGCETDTACQWIEGECQDA